MKKKASKNVIDINACADILNKLRDRVKSIEIYYNPYTTELVCSAEGAKLYNIITQEEV